MNSFLDAVFSVLIGFANKVSRRDNLDRYYMWQPWGYGLFVHRIHDDELVGIYHSHPWNGFSIIFGAYSEERYGEAPRLRRFFNVIKATRFHRVTLPNGPVWTMFFHGPRFNRWAVKDKSGRVLSEEPWRGVGGPTSYAGNN